MPLWTPICDLKSDNAQFNYCAQPAPAIAFTVLFGITFLAHFLQMFTFHKRFAWVVVMAACWEFTSFITRIFATKNQVESSSGPAANLLVLLAPLWVNAFVYMVFGRMVYFFLPEQKVFGVRAIHMARWFVWLDISSFIIQATGGVLSNDDSATNVKLGLRLYTIGIGVQEAFIVCFLFLVFRFHWKMVVGKGLEERGDGWRKLLYIVYGTLGLITVRIIFRITEFASLDPTSPASTNEAYFYAFDATPMCIALYLWNIVHPGSILVGPESLYPKKKKESRKQKKQRKRDERDAEAQALRMDERLPPHERIHGRY